MTRHPIYVFTLLLFAPAMLLAGEDQQTVFDIGSRLELFVHGHMIDQLSGEAQRWLHHPTPREIALAFDEPWEGSGSNYITIFRDGEVFRMYYRGAQVTVEDGKLVQPHPQVVCYAESRDGVHWEKPELGLFEWDGSKENNIIWTDGRATHNFTPFKDARPGIPDDERYKALAYAPQGGRALAAFASADGNLLLREKLPTPQGTSFPRPNQFHSHGYVGEMSDAVDCALDPSRAPQSGPLMAWDTLAVLMSAYESSDRGGAFVDLSEFIAARDFPPEELPDPQRFGAVFQRTGA